MADVLFSMTGTVCAVEAELVAEAKVVVRTTWVMVAVAVAEGKQ